MRWLYRIQQFYRAGREAPAEAGLARAQVILPPELFELFTRMLPFEQAHAIRVMQRLVEAGYEESDLLTAALLHDVGKTRRPLRPWERGLAVIIRAVLPDVYTKLAGGAPVGFWAPIVVTARHAEWGAEMVEQAGANHRVVWLIRHHDANLTGFSQQDVDFLRKLQKIDSTS